MGNCGKPTKIRSSASKPILCTGARGINFKRKNIMKTVTIRGIMADFLDSIRAYEHESGEAIHSDERESSEFVDMYLNGEGKLKIEEEKYNVKLEELK